MAAVIAALPAMHLVCNIVVSGGESFNNATNPAVNQLPRKPLPSPSLPEGYVVYPDIGVAYKVSDEIVSWFVAKERCARDNAHLAVIDSALKIQLVRSQKPSANLTHVGVYLMDGYSSWLGAKTGLALTSVPWANGEPNGDGKCAVIKRADGGLGRYSCITAGDYVCELPMPRNYADLKNSLGLDVIVN